jgi:hypothetical protein
MITMQRGRTRRRDIPRASAWGSRCGTEITAGGVIGTATGGTMGGVTGRALSNLFTQSYGKSACPTKYELRTRKEGMGKGTETRVRGRGGCCGKGFGGQGLLEGREGPQGNVVVSDIPQCLIMNAGCTAGAVRWDRRGGAGAEEEENEQAEDEGESHAG